MKIITCILILSWYALHVVRSAEIGIEMALEKYRKHREKMHKADNYQKVTSLTDELPEKKIYFENWIKYLHFSENSLKNKLKNFFKNDVFEVQKQYLSPIELKEKEEVTDHFNKIGKLY